MGWLDLLDISQHHTTAVAALHRNAGYPVYEVEVTDDGAGLTYPYLVLYPTPGATATNTLAGTSGEFTFRWQITAVGRDWMETCAAIDRARAAAVDQRPVVTGRTVGMVTEVITSVSVAQDPAARDPATGRPLFYAINQFAVMSYLA
jgi:hypothetical protein